MEKQQTVSFFGLLMLLFIGLKLGGAIDWNWFWVLSPITVPIAFLAVIFTWISTEDYFEKKRKRNKKWQ